MSKKIIGLVTLVALTGMVLAPVAVQAFDLSTVEGVMEALRDGHVTWEEARDLINALTGGTGAGITPEGPPDYGSQDVLDILDRVINYAFGILLVFVVLMIIISGWMFVTAGGNPERITSARKFLMFALIGLAIAVLAKGLVALVQMVIGPATGA